MPPGSIEETRRVATRDLLPCVAVISLGGTIASLPAESGEHSSAALPRLDAADLVAALPELGGVARVTDYPFRRLPSPSLRLEDIIELSATIRTLYAGGCDGVVVTQGTDTLEETSFVLDLLHTGPETLVLTGAMRVANAPGADGLANLSAAIRVAAVAEARGLGTLVVMADQIHAARWVAKRHTSSVSAFDSPTTGPLGWVSEGKARIALRPLSSPILAAPSPSALRPVATVALGLGDDGQLLAGLPELGYAGLVVEGVGGGHVPGSTVATLATLAAQMPVVVASRTGSGELLRTTYGFPGSEVDLLSRGMISAGALSAPKARLLLMLLIATGTKTDDLADVFARFAIPAGGSAAQEGDVATRNRVRSG